MALILMTHRLTIWGCVRDLKIKIERKHDSRPTSFTNNARIINSCIILSPNNAGIETSRIVPKMREPGILRIKIGVRIPRKKS